ncbi:MAG: Chromosome segregation protein Spo0J containing CBS and ParB-like nuclease domain [Candidatus Methanohalarchaeum thermophilum]|uniref:Chromosome segregation protein Spo0J containing CBS and ParB-like nuclease domain n=1 Tax=Methanohalarchaeum thermophilum TaxID=1903181 RepID=A0A1Q6DUN5_METT1|nr:MAG: Chromosome segregation protein Spo0J containing CBS and ParB-like nuclease domain [Candidatus Methanohalarchaeum thermophilum]
MSREINESKKDKKNKPKVKDYMTTDVVVVEPEDTVEEIAKLIEETGHNGFPVVEKGIVKGYIAARHLVLQDKDELAFKLMSSDITLADRDMDLDDAARLMFRKGISKLPVVRETGRMAGIITNSDVIRSQIERADPRKLRKFKKVLEDVHNINLDIEKGEVKVNELIPTQKNIYEDELEGRIYELKKGLAEPIIIVQKPDKMILVDGHHRAVAAKKLEIDKIEAYKLIIKEDKTIGLEKIPKKSGISNLDDIKIIDYAPHPIGRLTKMYGQDNQGE